MLSTTDMKGSPTFTLRQVAQSRTSVHSSRHLAPQQCTVFRSGKEMNGLAQQKSKMSLEENHNLHPNWGCSLTGEFQPIPSSSLPKPPLGANQRSLTWMTTPRVLPICPIGLLLIRQRWSSPEYPDSKCYGIFGWLYPVWQWCFQQCCKQFSVSSSLFMTLMERALHRNSTPPKSLQPLYSILHSLECKPRYTLILLYLILVNIFCARDHILPGTKANTTWLVPCVGSQDRKMWLSLQLSISPMFLVHLFWYCDFSVTSDEHSCLFPTKTHTFSSHSPRYKSQAFIDIGDFLK